MSPNHSSKALMSQRLKSVQEWEPLAQQAQYRAHELALLCQVSLRTLQRHFRLQYGLTVSGWLREVRLRKAYSGLVQGATVKEMAFDLGYKQLSHFSRDFKSYFGVSPSFLSGVSAFREFPSELLGQYTPGVVTQAIAV